MRVDQELFGDPLPTYLTRFVGRGRELSGLDALVGSTRLVTICGIGGAGKSRLAAEFARRSRVDPGSSGFRHGVVWVPLVTVTEPDDVPRAVAAALDLPGAARGHVNVALQQALGDRHLLLVLDNCEHLACACAGLVDTLLAVCPNLSVLATGRRPLECDVEVVFDLPPLGAGAHEAGDDVALFIDRATMTSPTYALTEANSEAVREICARLGGLPLAIELVASWIRVLSPTDIVATLREGSALLSSANAQVEERHRSIHAVLEGTWRWLGSEERRVLRGLGVFRGGFDRTGAEFVAGATLASLSVLADHSLIQRMPDSTGGSRYHLHELVRAYAAERLSDLPAEAVDDVRARHFDHFLSLVEQADAVWQTRDEQQALVALDADHTDVEAALAWAIGARDSNRALRMTAGLFAFWVYTAKFGRIASTFARVLDLPWDPSSTTAIRDRGRALHSAGWDALLAQDVDLADRRFQEGLVLSERVADSESAAANLRALASVRRTSGDVVGDGHYLERALALSCTVGDERGTAWARNDLAGVAYSRGGVEEAIALVEEAVDSFERLGMGFGAYQAQLHLGELRLQAGQPALALDCLGRASAIQEGQHFVGHGSELFEGVAEVAAGTHRFELAATLLGAGDSWRQIFGHPHADSLQSSDTSASVATRRRLGRAAFTKAYEAGRRLRWDQSQDLLRTTIAELTAALAGSPAGLTSREVEVLRLVALGLSNAEIGDRLVVSTRTVHAHLRSIYDKLDVTTRTAAAHEAARIGVA